MNILQCLLILAALASLFVTGPNMIPEQSYAASGGVNGDDHAITKDYKDTIQKDVDAEPKRTNQHLGQDNLCYKDDDCEQANEGEQTEGKDNAASGFNDQSKSIQQQQQPGLPITPTTGTLGNGTTPIPTSTPTPTTSTLTVTKHVVCDFPSSSTVPCPMADDFNITAATGNGSSYTYSGSESGTPLTINPPFPVTYQITETSPTQGFVVATIPVGTQPIGVAFNPDNGFVYVTNYNGNTVSVIDSTTNTVVATIPVGSNPRDVAFNPDNGLLYVANTGSNTVSVIAPLTTTFSEGCNGTIDSGGQEAICTITNAYGRPA